MQQKPPRKKAKFHTPQNVLRTKAGYGGLDPVVLDRAENFIQSNNVDFAVIAQDILNRLDKAVEDVKSEGMRSKESIERILAPVMELKANGAMFKFSLVSDVADIALDFLENIDHLNDDAFEIVSIHRKAIKVILKNRLYGTGGQQGTVLVKELNEACRRYNKKYGSEFE